MKNLQQELYKNDNGHDIEAARIQVLTPYKYHVDGFYQWACGSCEFEHHSRSCGWPISGQVLECESCHKMNLLVRTNCVEIDETLQGKWKSEERDKENDRLKGIKKFNEEQMKTYRRKVLDAVQHTIQSLREG